MNEEVISGRAHAGETGGTRLLCLPLPAARACRKGVLSLMQMPRTAVAVQELRG